MGILQDSDKWKYPQLGQNVVKFVKMVRVCKNIGCYEKVHVAEVNEETGEPTYFCPVHGKRTRNQMTWNDITGASMIEFRKVGL